MPEVSVLPEKDDKLVASSANAAPYKEMAIESDAEASFEKGSPRFFKRRKQNSLPANSNNADSRINTLNDPLVYPETRKQWASNLLGSGICEDPDEKLKAGKGPPVVAQDESSSPSPPLSSPDATHGHTLFSRFRKGSLAALPSAFTSFRKRKMNTQSQIGDGESWSSDSSSSDHPLNDYDIRHRPGSSLAGATGAISR